MSKDFDLTGKVCVVTGAGRGIGRGMAEGLARHGATVVLSGRTRTTLEEAATAIGGKATVQTADVSKGGILHAECASQQQKQKMRVGSGTLPCEHEQHDRFDTENGDALSLCQPLASDLRQEARHDHADKKCDHQSTAQRCFCHLSLQKRDGEQHRPAGHVRDEDLSAEQVGGCIHRSGHSA